MKSRLFWAGVAAIALAAGVACSNSTTGSSGALTVKMTDSPFTDAKALLVTFSDVSVHASGGDWFPATFAGGATSRTCDLKQLTSASDVLGVAPLSQGHYTEIRLTISSANIYFDNASTGGPCAASIAAPAGKSSPVNVPSGTIRLNRDFDLGANAAMTMLLDFHGDESVHEIGNGNYQMTPVISIVSVQ